MCVVWRMGGLQSHLLSVHTCQINVGMFEGLAGLCLESCWGRGPYGDCLKLVGQDA
jgi:hypothetical protein